MLSRCPVRSGKCNSCSLRDKQNGWFTSARPAAQMIQYTGRVRQGDFPQSTCGDAFVIKMLMLGAHATFKLLIPY